MPIVQSESLKPRNYVNLRLFKGFDTQLDTVCNLIKNRKSPVEGLYSYGSSVEIVS